VISLLVVFKRLFQAARRGWRDPAFRGLLILAFTILVVGMFFYRRVEGWTLLNSLYFSVVTLTTVGYGDLSPQTGAGRAFTIFYVLIGLGIIIGLVTQLASKAVEAQAERTEQRQKKRKTGE